MKAFFLLLLHRAAILDFEVVVGGVQAVLQVSESLIWVNLRK